MSSILVKGGASMNDDKIIELYWIRNEQAIYESSKKYGAYCNTIARNILMNWADAEECVNDTWLHAWNAIPPHKPSVLSVFFGKITRNLAFDLYKSLHREKRGGHTIDLVLDELAECVSGNDNPERNWQKEALKEEIDHFLSGLPKEKRYMFVLRYWYADSIPAIAERFQTSENNVSVTLNRIRKKLRTHLTERGYDL